MVKLYYFQSKRGSYYISRINYEEFPYRVAMPRVIQYNRKGKKGVLLSNNMNFSRQKGEFDVEPGWG